MGNTSEMDGMIPDGRPTETYSQTYKKPLYRRRTIKGGTTRVELQVPVALEQHYRSSAMKRNMSQAASGNEGDCGWIHSPEMICSPTSWFVIKPHKDFSSSRIPLSRGQRVKIFDEASAE
jgi:hypothetical protein